MYMRRLEAVPPRKICILSVYACACLCVCVGVHMCVSVCVRVCVRGFAFVYVRVEDMRVRTCKGGGLETGQMTERKDYFLCIAVAQAGGMAVGAQAKQREVWELCG